MLLDLLRLALGLFWRHVIRQGAYYQRPKAIGIVMTNATHTTASAAASIASGMTIGAKATCGPKTMAAVASPAKAKKPVLPTIPLEAALLRHMRDLFLVVPTSWGI
jgi:hypothetical protein